METQHREADDSQKPPYPSYEKRRWAGGRPVCYSLWVKIPPSSQAEWRFRSHTPEVTPYQVPPSTSHFDLGWWWRIVQPGSGSQSMFGCQVLSPQIQMPQQCHLWRSRCDFDLWQLVHQCQDPHSSDTRGHQSCLVPCLITKSQGHVETAPLLMLPVGIMYNTGTRPPYKIKYAQGFLSQLPSLNWLNIHFQDKKSQFSMKDIVRWFNLKHCTSIWPLFS